MAEQIDIPRQWPEIDVASLRGTVMVMGEADVGKSTFCRYLYERLCSITPRVAYLDGDPGQSTLGPPCTMTLALAADGDNRFPPRARIWRHFVGATSPRGHMLQVLIGGARLTAAAQEAGAQVVLYDTTGFVSHSGGGANLKLAKIELLRPEILIAIQRGREMEPLLTALRRSHRVAVLEVPSSSAAQRRWISERQAYRAAQFALYFFKTNRLAVDWEEVAVFPAPDFEPSRLAALEDQEGFVIELGIVEGAEAASQRVILRTPLKSMRSVNAIRLGDVGVDSRTFRDWPWMPEHRGEVGRDASAPV